MNCTNNWTIKFRGVNKDGSDPFEIAPVEMSLKMSRSDYDFCRAKFPNEVGKEIKPETTPPELGFQGTELEQNPKGRGEFNERKIEEAGGVLYDYTPVDVCYEGNPVQRLVFRPDWVTYGNDYTHIEFQDIHKALSDGVVDIQRSTIELKQIYRDVVDNISDNLIKGVKFTIPNGVTRNIVGANGVGREFFNQDDKVSKDEISKYVNRMVAVDFEKENGEKVIEYLNKVFNINTWATSDGYLGVGLQQVNQMVHLAAPDDERVWRYHSPQISHSREPIKQAIVEGSWVDEPGIGSIDEGINEIASWFSDDPSEARGSADVRAIGVAEREGVEDGTTVIVKNTSAKKGALPKIAKFALEAKMREQRNGTIEIDPNLSGTEVSSPVDLNAGDRLRLVPRDKHFAKPSATSGQIGYEPEDSCGNFVHNEEYLVTEVEHAIDQSGNWKIFVDIALIPNVEIDTEMTYYDPDENEEVSDSQINEDGDLAFYEEQYDYEPGIGQIFEGI